MDNSLTSLAPIATKTGCIRDVKNSISMATIWGDFFCRSIFPSKIAKTTQDKNFLIL